MISPFLSVKDGGCQDFKFLLVMEIICQNILYLEPILRANELEVSLMSEKHIWKCWSDYLDDWTVLTILWSLPLQWQYHPYSYLIILAQDLNIVLLKPGCLGQKNECFHEVYCVPLSHLSKNTCSCWATSIHIERWLGVKDLDHLYFVRKDVWL